MSSHVKNKATSNQIKKKREKTELDEKKMKMKKVFNNNNCQFQ